MARKKKKSKYLFPKIFLALCAVFALSYYLVNRLILKPHIIYPQFGIYMPENYSIHGIDVSRYQRNINWKEVALMEIGGIQIGFAFIKATEGTDYADPQFRRNWREASNCGIPIGAYHFFIPGKNPAAQALHFSRKVKLRSGDLPPVLDVEVNTNLSVKQMRADVKTWLLAIESRYSVKPIIYTNVSFYEKYFREGFEDYPLWIAHYLQKVRPRVEKDWAFWQHSESGNVNGIKGKVDFNVFSGDSAAFRKILIP